MGKRGNINLSNARRSHETPLKPYSDAEYGIKIE
jgi:hypothetical protein